ncbi:unnamed protein product [Caenorhabditis angaria]|uniref:TBC1 domain family member 23 n=1 Tax=Caenorhabditis angaria TaxID=860376 RepID=A0A9P1NBZ5_9PELO|nr:unnamed protein product [Caenorhabditis angaria]
MDDEKQYVGSSEIDGDTTLDSYIFDDDSDEDEAIAATDNPQFWVELLGVATKPDPYKDWSNIYDLNSQIVLRNDCRMLAARVNYKKTVVELEEMLTLYCKKRNCDYSKDNGWIEILEKVIQLNFSKKDEFNVFFAITTKYIPNNTRSGAQIYDLFRLLLQYHSPDLSNLLDSLNILPSEYAQKWFNTLFAYNMPFKICIALWKCIFETGDPFLVFHMAVNLVLEKKASILKLGDKKAILEDLNSLTANFDIKNVEHQIPICEKQSNNTPACFQKDFHYVLFGANFDDEIGDIQVNKLLCLAIPAIDLASSDDDSSGKVNFFVIDARSNIDFDSGHFISSFNLDCSMIVDDPAKFDIALDALFEYKNAKRDNDHFLFLGYGDDSKDQYMNMVIAQFIQRKLPHVSFVQGGYKKLHNHLMELGKSELLSMHSDETCLVCNNGKVKSKGWGFMSRMKSAVANTSSRMKERVEAVVYPIGETSADHVHHVDPKERHGKRYKQQSVFSLEDKSDDETSELNTSFNLDSNGKLVLPSEFIAHFDCKEIFQDGQIDAYIAVTRTQIHFIHDSGNGQFTTYVRYHLSNLTTVSSKSKVPEILTFKFGNDIEGTTSRLRFYVPKAGECVQAVKSAFFSFNPDSKEKD